MLFDFIFIVILQLLFLPPAHHAVLKAKKTYYYTEEESRADECQENPAYHLVLERARILLVCSNEAYLPYFEQERPPNIEETKLTGFGSSTNEVTVDVESIRADSEKKRALPPHVDAIALAGHEKTLSATIADDETPSVVESSLYRSQFTKQ
eukprot:CAMPEP_0195535970 /NCGR_PEP_ID=MMETSP0794_2-20130614/45236_1 /TAXON_ID=515487 /ORGANISM="Stephanopyxis turris, Strain CCMP 815" /LENGTH=151 /DNA_ID=CAMNT_0040669251 /DNA_START=313 /DNA_END=765 /DNA_ORIENTATION=-